MPGSIHSRGGVEDSGGPMETNDVGRVTAASRHEEERCELPRQLGDGPIHPGQLSLPGMWLWTIPWDIKSADCRK